MKTNGVKPRMKYAIALRTDDLRDEVSDKGSPPRAAAKYGDVDSQQFNAAETNGPACLDHI
jgi:hypothetical protein